MSASSSAAASRPLEFDPGRMHEQDYCANLDRFFLQPQASLPFVGARIPSSHHGDKAPDRIEQWRREAALPETEHHDQPTGANIILNNFLITLRSIATQLQKSPSIPAIQKEQVQQISKILAIIVEVLRDGTLSDEETISLIRATNEKGLQNLTTLGQIIQRRANAVVDPIQRQTIAALIGSVVASTLIGTFYASSVYKDPQSTPSKLAISAFIASGAIPVSALTVGMNKTQKILQIVASGIVKIPQAIETMATTVKDTAIAVKDHVIEYKYFYGTLAVGAACFVAAPYLKEAKENFMAAIGRTGSSITPPTNPAIAAAAPAVQELVAALEPADVTPAIAAAIIDSATTQTVAAAAPAIQEFVAALEPAAEAEIVAAAQTSVGKVAAPASAIDPAAATIAQAIVAVYKVSRDAASATSNFLSEASRSLTEKVADLVVDKLPFLRTL